MGLLRGSPALFVVLAAAQYGIGNDCGGPVTPIDAGSDSGVAADAGVTDAGTPDAGPPDAGQVDGGTSDSGFDAGSVDAGDPCAPLQFVQAVPGTTKYEVMQQTDTQSWAITLTRGNFLIALAYAGQGPLGGGTPDASTAPNMIFQISDDALNTYSAGPFVENGTSNYSALQVFFAPNVTGGATTVTLSYDAGIPLNYFTGLLLEEYAGIASTSPVDVSTVEIGSTPTLSITGGTLVTSAACGVVLAAFTDGDVTGETIVPGSGWTFRSTDFWDPGACLDDGPAWARANTTFNGTIATETVGASNTWVATQMAFRSAATSPSPQPTGITFASGEQTVDAGICSSAVTVDALGAGSTARSGDGFWLDLSAANATTFVDPSCQFPASRVYLGAGTDSQSFYFRGAAAGPLTLGASAPGFQQITQVEQIH